MAEEESFRITDRRRRPDDTAEATAGMPPAEPSDTRSAPAGAPPAGEPTLEGLFLMLASSALVHLGEAEDPATGQRAVDPAQAREAIDLLMLLRSRTEGNRTEHESRLLDEVLYDLQLRFVQVRQARSDG